MQNLQDDAVSAANSTFHNTTDLSFNTTLTTILPIQNYTTIDIILLCILSTIFIISTLTNTILLRTIWLKHGINGSAGSQFLFHLCAINLAQTMLILPLHIANTASHHKMGHWFAYVERRCYAPGAGLDYFMRISWMLVAQIAFDRHMAIVHTLNYRKKMTKGVTMVFLCFAWLYPVVVSLIGLLSWNELKYDHCDYFCMAEHRGDWIFLTAEFSASFLLPLVVMAYCWGKIFVLSLSKKMKVYIGAIAPVEGEKQANETSSTSTGMRRSSSGVSIGSITSSVPGEGRKTSATVFSYNTSYRAIRTVLIVVGSFLLTSGVYVVVTLIESTREFPHPDSWLKAMAICSIFSSTAIYPLVYGFMNRTIRREIRSVLRAYLRRSSISTQTTPRRWSISSHVLDYLPTFNVANNSSRRTSADSIVLPPLNGRESATDTSSNSSSVLNMFFKSKASRRRVSAPGKLQHGGGSEHGPSVHFVNNNGEGTARKVE